jgi:hypothetical protein
MWKCIPHHRLLTDIRFFTLCETWKGSLMALVAKKQIVRFVGASLCNAIRQPFLWWCSQTTSQSISRGRKTVRWKFDSGNSSSFLPCTFATFLLLTSFSFDEHEAQQVVLLVPGIDDIRLLSRHMHVCSKHFEKEIEYRVLTGHTSVLMEICRLCRLKSVLHSWQGKRSDKLKIMQLRLCISYWSCWTGERTRKVIRNTTLMDSNFVFTRKIKLHTSPRRMNTDASQT